MNFEADETIDLSERNLYEYYEILYKHRWTIIPIFLIIVTLVMILTFLTTPVYQATATLVIDKEQTVSPLTGERMDYESYLSQSMTFKTHFKLIKSREVMLKLIRKLELDQVREKQGMETRPWKILLARFKKNLSLILAREEEMLTIEDMQERLIIALQQKITIEEVRDTRLLNINVKDNNPELAREIANTVAAVYIEFDITNRLKYSKNTVSWMGDQLYEIKKKLEDAEQEFLEFKQAEKIFSIEGRQNIISQKIEEFNDTYIEARNSRLEIGAKLTELERSVSEKDSLIYARTLVGNSLIERLYSQLLEQEVELSRLSQVYKSSHPKMEQINTKKANILEKLEQEISREIEGMQAAREVLIVREKVLLDTITDFEKEAMDINAKELRYVILQRNVQTNQKLYETLLSKVKETNVTGSGYSSNIRITGEAVTPSNPILPKKKMNLLLSIIFGLMVGVGISFLLEYMDQTLRTEEDIEKYLNLPVLSVVPVGDLSNETEES